MALAPAFAELSQLRQSLSRLNYAGEVSDMVLFPGQQRWTLIRWLMKGLLCGREVESIAVPGVDDRDMSLPEQELLAARCVHLLAALGVSTTLDDVQGCCPEHLRCKLLTRLAQLLSAALPFQAAILTRSTSAAAAGTGQQASQQQQQQQAPVEAWLERSLGLLEWAVGAKGALLQDHAALFPADLCAAADQYREAAPLLSQLQEALATQLQRVQAEVQQLQGACGGSKPLARGPCGGSHAPDASGGRPDADPSSSSSSSHMPLFPQLLPDAGGSAGGPKDQSNPGNSSSSSSMAHIGQQLQRLLGQLQELSGMYDERLSVWAREEAVAASSSAPGATSSSSSEALGQEMGAAAARVDELYRQVVQLLRVVGSLQGHYTAITQKLPRAFLQQVTEQHRQEAEALAACCQALGPSA